MLVRMSPLFSNPTISISEQQRLKELRSYGLINSSPSEEFDLIVQLASSICDCPIAMLSIVDDKNIWFKARTGIDITQIPRHTNSFCECALECPASILTIENAALDENFKNHPFVVESPYVKFYTGVVIFSKAGARLGTLCVLDNKPRKLNSSQITQLRMLADFASHTLEHFKQSTLLTQKLRRRRKQLLISTKFAALGEMAGSIAHEIQTPLTAILGRLSLLEKKLKSHSADLAKCIEMAENLSKVVKGLNVYIRESSQDPKEVCNAWQLVLNTLAICEHRFRLNSVPIVLEPPEKALFVLCRPSQVAQILLNLISNSFDAIRSLEEKWIRISVRPSRNMTHLEFEIQDSGRGIPIEVKHNMFNPSYTTKPPGQGLGIGLTLSRSLAKSHSGTLEYLAGKSNTTFRLLLPMYVAKSV